MNKIKEFLLSDNGSSASSIGTDLIVLVLSLVFLWIIFEKAGEKGWKAIIPFYNLYILFKITWKTSYFWFTLALIVTMICGICIIAINPDNVLQGGIGTSICIASVVGLLIIYLNLLSCICYSFNKGGLCMLGLIFLNIIFLGIIAFDKSEYVGPKVK